MVHVCGTCVCGAWVCAVHGCVQCMGVCVQCSMVVNSTTSSGHPLDGDSQQLLVLLRVHLVVLLYQLVGTRVPALHLVPSACVREGVGMWVCMRAGGCGYVGMKPMKPVHVHSQTTRRGQGGHSHVPRPHPSRERGSGDFA